MRDALDNQMSWLKCRSELLKQYEDETECCGRNLFSQTGLETCRALW